MAPWVPFWKYIGYVLYVVLHVSVSQEIWNYPPETLKTVAFKFLPIAHLILVIILTETTLPGFSGYKSRIIYGLLFSMIGDALLVWRFTLFLPGLLFFAFAHLCYISAFQLKPFGKAPTIVSCIIPCLTAYLVILPGITEGMLMYIMVAIYTALLFTMVWRSVVYYQTWPSFGSFCACFGAVVFAISDFLIAYDKWRSPIDGAAFYITAFYFLAQLFIATSVTCY